jgi:hypothetical protein
MALDNRHVEMLRRQGEIVRASGICSVCDFKFRNEVVLRLSCPRDPGGWNYVELRHLTDGTYHQGPRQSRGGVMRR